MKISLSSIFQFLKEKLKGASIKNKSLKVIDQDDYEKLFGLNDSSSESTNKRKEALQYAIETRKFEIDLYWKRAAYFWTFIGVVFAGYVVVKSAKDLSIYDKTWLSVIIGCLGFVFSFAWFYVNKGSKYWQENWENHVDLLENLQIGPLFKVVIDRPEKDKKEDPIRNFVVGPDSYSVSKINQVVSLYVTILWIVVIIADLYYLYDPRAIIDWRYFILLPITMGACMVMVGCCGTDKDNYKNLFATIRETKIGKK